MMNAVEVQLRAVLGPALEHNRSLAGLTSFKIGGPAELFATVADEEQLSRVMEAAYQHSVPVFCLGAGTNLLVSDRGIGGLVLSMDGRLSSLTVQGSHVTAGAAMHFRTLVSKVIEQGLAGLEFGEGIPGTVGGGLVMNAGAFGGEIARVVTLVHGITQTGARRSLTNQEIGFAYRRSALPRGFVITEVEFDLAPGDRRTMTEQVQEIRSRREARQPGDYPNAGSVFKNPPGTFAGRLLEAAGLKGTRIGGAAFSARHANFIVNLGSASADDVRRLIELARDKVHKATGVMLETEVKLVGEW